MFRFRLYEPVISRRSLKHGQIIRIEDGLFECEMSEPYFIEGKRYENCKFWFREADLLKPYEVTQDMQGNDTWNGANRVKFADAPTRK